LPQLIKLHAASPLVSGAYRNVYQHPHHDDLLVKVIKPIVIERHAARARWYDSWYGSGYYKALLREIEKYLVLQRRGQQDLPFIQHFVGLIETDVGLGMVVSKVSGRDGKLAPTLLEIVRARGLDTELASRIAALRDDVIRNHVVFGDVSASNIVEAADAPHGHRLVIIDGLNDRLWLPVNFMSRSFNRMYCERRFARMMQSLVAIDRERTADAAGSPIPVVRD
jgi:hypothetical protein